MRALPFVFGLLAVVPLAAQGQPESRRVEAPRVLDRELLGVMRDILSNVLMHDFDKPEAAVRDYLDATRPRCKTSAELVEKCSVRFEIELTALKAKVESFRHVEEVDDDPSDELEARDGEVIEVTSFAESVLMHVVLHELGHALVREFDLPVLANEETLADTFATYYLVTHEPDLALASLQARIDSLMFEARELPRAEWTVQGEHNSDARRAYQIAAIALAADGAKYAPLGRAVGMDSGDVRSARDYGSEIHRSWRRILRPLWMPAGEISTEARVRFDDVFDPSFSESKLAAMVSRAVRGFDWHSQVTIHFAGGDGGASWSRSKRTVTVRGGYVRRFVGQGEAIGRTRRGM